MSSPGSKVVQLFTLLMLASSCRLFAIEGGLIDLTNYDSNHPILMIADDGSTIPAPIIGTMVEVLGGPVGGPLYVLGNTVGVMRFNLVDRGFFDAGFGQVPGVGPLSNAWFKIRAWRGANSWQEAVELNTFAGESALFINGTGYDNGPPGPPVPGRMSNAPPVIIMRGFAQLAVNRFEDTLIVSWRGSPSNFILERALDFDPEIMWQSVTNLSLFHDWRIVVMNRTNLSRGFFRLRKQ